MSTSIHSHVGPFPVNPTAYRELLAITQNPELTKEEQAVLLSALKQGYLVDSTRRPNDYGRTRASALWRSWCETLAIPFIRFLPRRLYTPAELDLRPAHKLVKREHCQQLREVILTYDTTKQPRNAIGPDRWSGGQIPVSKIDEVAAILLDAALHHCLEYESNDLSPW